MAPNADVEIILLPAPDQNVKKSKNKLEKVTKMLKFINLHVPENTREM